MADEKPAFFENSMKDDEKRFSAHEICFRSGSMFTEDFKKGLRRIFTLLLAQTIADFANKKGELPETDEGIAELLQEVGKRFIHSAHKLLAQEVVNELKHIVKNVDVREAFEISTGEHL